MAKTRAHQRLILSAVSSSEASLTSARDRSAARRGWRGRRGTVGTPGRSGVRGLAMGGAEGNGGVNSIPASFQCAPLALSALRPPLGPGGSVVQEPLRVARGRRPPAHSERAPGIPGPAGGSAALGGGPSRGRKGAGPLASVPGGGAAARAGRVPPRAGAEQAVPAELWTAAGPSAAPSAWSRSGSR